MLDKTIRETVCDLLIIGTRVDQHIDYVLQYIPEEVKYCRLNIDEYPLITDISFSLEQSKTPEIIIKAQEEIFDISKVKVVWFRRIGAPTIDQRIEKKAHRVFALGEVEAAIFNLAYLLSEAQWISPFESTKRASSKLYQLKIAGECGLNFPETLVTNSVNLAGKFLSSSKPILYKTLLSPSVIYDNSRSLIFSHLLDEKDINLLYQVQYVPCQFQKYAEKAYELRITFTGNSFHTVKINSQINVDAKIDWRAVGLNELTYEIIPLPTEIEDKLRLLLKKLDLNYGAIDMIVTPNGEYVFLEVNPHGAWGWLEKALDLSISQSLAHHICSFISGENISD